MFNREQFLMTGVVFLFLVGTFALLSGATVLRNQQLYSHQVSNINYIRHNINRTPILDRVPIESNNSNRPQQEGNNHAQSNIMYSADFNNLVNIRTLSKPLNSVIFTDNEVRERERSRLDELRARNQNSSALKETTTNNSETAQNDENPYHTQANLERGSDFPCINVWDELDKKEITHSICIELYRDNGDNQSNYEKDTLVGFTLVTDHISEHTPDYYEFNNLPSGTYFAKFYHLGHEAPVFQAIQTATNSHTEEHYNSWQTAQIQATLVDAGYSVRFEREENNKILEELNGITVLPSWEND